MEWYYVLNEERHGPLDEDSLRALYTDGELGPTDLVWNEDMDDWQPASLVFADVVAQPAVSFPSDASSKDKATASTGEYCVVLRSGGESPATVANLIHDEVLSAVESDDVDDWTDALIAEALSIASGPMCVVKTGVSKSDAKAFAELLREAGADAVAEYDGMSAEDNLWIARLYETGANKIAVIKAIRASQDIGLAAAKELTESTPVEIAAGESRIAMERLAARLITAGAQADVVQRRFIDLPLSTITEPEAEEEPPVGEEQKSALASGCSSLAWLWAAAVVISAIVRACN